MNSCASFGQGMKTMAAAFLLEDHQAQLERLREVEKVESRA